jgi:hypothetical protein
MYSRGRHVSRIKSNASIMSYRQCIVSSYIVTGIMYRIVMYRCRRIIIVSCISIMSYRIRNITAHVYIVIVAYLVLSYYHVS